jgi:hypothetical protein
MSLFFSVVLCALCVKAFKGFVLRSMHPVAQKEAQCDDP